MENYDIESLWIGVYTRELSLWHNSHEALGDVKVNDIILVTNELDPVDESYVKVFHFNLCKWGWIVKQWIVEL